MRVTPDALIAFKSIRYLHLGVASRADWVANILLYIPLAFSVCGALNSGRRSGRLGSALFSASICIALAFVVEWAQLFFPPRTVSINDLIAEVIGTVLGCGLWLHSGPRLLELGSRALESRPGNVKAAATLYALGYLAFSLFPYDFLISGVELAQKFASPRSAFFSPRPAAASWPVVRS